MYFVNSALAQRSDVSHPGMSPPQCAGNSSQNDGQPALKALEKSVEGIVGGAEVLSPLRDIDKWLRRKLGCYTWKQWGRAGYWELRKLDVYLLAAWSNAAARYEHNMRLAAKSDVIPVRGAKLSGLDPKDRPVMHNPFPTAARAYLKDMAMLAAELGFTPNMTYAYVEYSSGQTNPSISAITAAANEL